jgi:addiction module RelE/StbE family toxin
MRVRWTPRARDGFRQQTRYIARDSPTAARQVATRVRDGVHSLATHPLQGRPGRVVDTRELVVPRTPFTIAYRVREQIVEVVGIVHQAQQWPESFE